MSQTQRSILASREVFAAQRIVQMGSNVSKATAGMDGIDPSGSIEAELASLSVPAETLGLHILYEPRIADVEIVADVVAVHGIGGDSYSTFTDKLSNQLWLRDFLPRSTEFQNARILTFGYEAQVFAAPGETASTGRIFTFGEALLSALNDARVPQGARNRPIIFVAHSLGGLVVKSALVYAQTKLTLYGDIYRSSKAIIFFGTPHDGADIATWSTYLGKISTAIGIRSTKVAAELKRWSNVLVELSTLFSDQIPDLQITTFFEQHSVHGVLVVPEGSARLHQRNEVAVGLEANHRTICKYASIDSAVYHTVVGRLEAIMFRIREQMDEGILLPSVPTGIPSGPAQSRQGA